MTETWSASLWRTTVAWFSCLLATLVLTSVLDGRQWFVRAVGVMTLVAVLGACGRVARVPRPVIVAVQVVAGWCYLTALYASDYARSGFIPDRDSIEALQNLADEGFSQIETLTPPVTPSPGVSLVTVAAVLLVAIQIDLLAVSYRQTAVAGLPLLALYVVPATLLPDGVDAWLFTLPAFGFLLLLVTDSRDRLLGWGIPIGGRLADGARGRGTGQLSRMSRNVGLTVLSLSVIVPAGIPRVTDGAFGSKGIGDTEGRTISTLDPLVTMRRDLLNRTDVPLMRVRTDSARPSELYLRAVTLDEFNGVEWKAARREVRKFEGDFPDAPGLTATVETSPVETAVNAFENMQSDYLPMPYPATRLTVEGAWRLDELTGNVVSYEGRDQISGKLYTVGSLEVSPNKDDVDVNQEADSPYLKPYLQLPEIPEQVADTAKRVTRDAKGPLEIGIALQQWFRRPGNFVYDLRTPPGTGNSALLDFLRDRRGYCEHFATTMAVMARSLGVPSRINVGFTAGELADDGIERVISSDDAHAWPELWLPGVGWTRFEPTPGSALSNPSAPSWLNEGTTPDEGNEGDEQDETETEPDESEGQGSESQGGASSAPGSATIDCNVSPEAPGCEGNPPPEEPDPALNSENHWVRNSLLLLFGVFLLFSVRVVRIGLRRRRWAIAAREGGVVAAEMAWRELRDDTRDLGYFWSAARTPRQTVAELRTDAQMSPAGIAELMLIASTLERGRYAKDGGGVPAARLRTAGIAVRRDLAVKAGRVNRFRAMWIPRSPRERLKDVITTGGFFRPGIGHRALARTKQVIRTRSFKTT